MIEYVLTTFSDPTAPIVDICADGSMHGFQKHHHPRNIEMLGRSPGYGISTCTYPFQEQHLPEILEVASKVIETWATDQKVLMYAPDISWAERNMLFRYHKISQGLGMGLDIFHGDDVSVVRQWDAGHDSWQDLLPWQWREWFSIFYPVWIREWIASASQVSDDFLCVANRDIIEHTEVTLRSIAQHCGIQLVRDIQEFCDRYRQKQQYILDEYDLLDLIVQDTLQGRSRQWEPLTPVSEAMLQHRFREKGYEWHCHGLDIMPVDTIQLAEILYQPKKETHASTLLHGIGSVPSPLHTTTH